MKYIVRLVLGSTVFMITNFLGGCANIVPPSGGLRDSLPPVLIFSGPKDSSVNISPKQITLTFDEFVTLQNAQDNIIVSPTLKYTPRYDYKLRNVTIGIKDTLDPNTTYSIQFGDAIKDVNEGNILKNFRYVFSTGKTLDTYEYSGKILLAEKGKVDSTLIVLLHRNLNDSAIKKEKARYYTKVDGKGEFRFYNLSAGQYRVYVLPNDFTKKYDDSTKLFAFRSETLTINSSEKRDTLYAFEEVKRAEKQSTTTIKKDDKKISYTSNLETGLHDFLISLDIQFSKKLKHIDTAKFVLADTTYKTITGYTITTDTTKNKVTLSYPWKENTMFRLTIAKDAVQDSAGNTLVKNDTLRFGTRRESDYGSIRLRFSNINMANNPVLLFIQSDKIVEAIPLTSYELYRKLFRSGNYELRLLYDKNKNGIWDTGSFKLKKQPEVVQLITKPLVVRGNWDNEVTIVL